DLWLGLTDLYNLFHRPDLAPEHIAKVATESRIPAEAGFSRLQRLRALHVQLDQTVLAAYGWNRPGDFGPALELRHDFYPLDFLPENDRTRLTLHPESRREVLARLLKLNHQRAAAAEAAQKTATLTAPKKKAKRAQPALAEPVIELNLGLDLFGRPAVPAATERNLPSGARDTLGGVGYALQLVRELLNESGGALAWPRLVDAFTLATQPALMAQLTKSADAARVEAWTKRWNESLPPGSLLTAIEQLGSNNLVAERADGICTIRLKDGPKATASKHANYDAWLALSVLGPAPALPSAQPTLVIAEFDDFTRRMEALLVA
ncbi:MAG: hypothetical protein IT565_14300, partial [Rhodospirillales bacterium]|nr:hypothetical protein [Rhodospirillales bacterium]